jgi:HPt (histidine-containing phosphotransfer) domain-containing protein
MFWQGRPLRCERKYPHFRFADGEDLTFSPQRTKNDGQESHLMNPHAAMTPSASVAFDSISSPLNREELLARLDGDEALLSELVGLFLQDAPRLLQEAHTAMSQRNSTALFRAAHTFKGAVSNFGADEAVAVAWRLESTGRAADWSNAGPALHELEQVFRGLVPKLKRLASGA